MNQPQLTPVGCFGNTTPNERRATCIIERLSDFRRWKLWQANARCNHVHVVASATGFSGSKVRDQIKANCTRVLRQSSPVFVDRSVWSVGGDWKCINTEDELERVILYAGETQDRKERDA